MQMLIESTGSLSHVFKDTGKLAVVIQSTLTSSGHSCCSNELLNWLKVPDLNGVYVVGGKGLREQRKEWVRVKNELKIFGPAVNRVLLMADTALLRVAVPALGKHGDMQSCHGTIFTLADYELVPTWTFLDYKLTHVQPWMDRDLARFNKLTKPAQPLPWTKAFNVKDIESLVIDIETTGLSKENDTITTLGLQWSDNDRCLVTDTAQIDKCLSIIAASPIPNIVLHNAQFDLGFFPESFCDAVYGRVRDTMLLAKARGELVAGLKHLGNYYTARPGNYSWLSDASHNFDDPEYVCEDIDVTWRLWQLWRKEQARPVNELMARAAVMCVAQSRHGTAVDEEALSTLAIENGLHVVRLREELIAEYGVDPGHQAELCEVLAQRGHILSRKTASGESALTAEVLQELGLLDILEFRRAQKLDTAFVSKMQNLLRTNNTVTHHQTLLAARTGRTSMKEFNWQQLPKKGPGKKLVHSRFKNGVILNCDLKQAEVRVGAWLSEDHVLAVACQSGDMHKQNAARGFNIIEEEVTDDQRFQAKSLIFRSIFGGSAQNATQERVLVYMKKEFVQLFTWVERQKKLGQNNWSVTDAFGKVINLLDIKDYKSKWAAGRVGINGPIQGTSSHVAIAITVCLWELFRSAGLRSLVLFGVHDSFVCDVHPDELDVVIALIRQAFKMLHTLLPVQLRAMLVELPMDGEIQWGSSWANVKDCTPLVVSSGAI